MNFDELYQEVLLDHSKRPRNFGELAAEDVVHVHGDNPSCGDEIFLHVKFGPEENVEDVKFTGSGCAISQASASMMTLKLKGKPRAEAERLLKLFHDRVTGPVSGLDEVGPKELGDLNLFIGVRKFPQRVKCAMLAWRAFEQALQESPTGGEAQVSTEEAE